MYPVLLNIGPVSISSFGFFVALGFLMAVFTIWKLAKAYDLDGEVILDLTLWGFFAGFILARVLFVILNWSSFGSFQKAILVYKYPGFSFWGGIIGGCLTIWYFTKKHKLQPWQILDLAAPSFLIGASIADVGCFLGGCFYGSVSNWPIATHVVGLIGKRLPIPLVEALIYYLMYIKLQRMVIKYHFPGKIFALSLISLGIIKFILDFFRGDIIQVYFHFSLGQVFASLTLFLGIAIFYIQAKRSPLEDIKYLTHLITSKRDRVELMTQLNKSWYNNKVYWQITLKKWWTELKRRFNVRATPKDPR